MLWKLRIAVSALVALSLVLGLAGAARASRPPIKPSHGKPYVPVTGDWEGTWHGFPASFELLYGPGDSVYRGYAPYGYSDIVFIEPGSCPANTTNYFEYTVGEGGQYPIRSNGSFGLRTSGIAGGLTGPRSASLSTSVTIDKCRQTLTWRLHPTHRRPVYDGKWRLRFADGESQTFTVSAGGRLATGIGFPAAIGSCGGPVGGTDLFIGANGVGSYVSRHSVKVRLAFGKRTASGEMSVPGSSCKPVRMSASLIKRAR